MEMNVDIQESGMGKEAEGWMSKMPFLMCDSAHPFSFPC